MSCLAATISTAQTLQEICTDSALSKELAMSGTFCPVPKYGTAFWKDSLSASMRKSYVDMALEYKDFKWESIDPILFSQFRKIGDRTNYEQFIFRKRNALAILAMAEIAEGKGRFMPDVLKGIQSVCEETWWGIPAHYPKPVPIESVQSLDLFNAEAGSMMAWIYYALGDQIAAFSPLLKERLRDEIKRRILDPALEHRSWWYSAGMNWNPWICSNWLTCALLVEPERERQIKAVELIAKSLDGFVSKYPADGGCDEGPGYWDRATGSLLDCLVLLHKATNGMTDKAVTEKVRNMVDFLAKMNINNHYFVNVADAPPSRILNPHWMPGALLVKSRDLQSLCNIGARANNYLENPASIYDADCVLGRELLTLCVLNEFHPQDAGDALPFSCWLPSVQVVTARSRADSPEGLFFAAKGGHNAESHNHNDVGEFIVYANGKPLLIDPGNATYTSKSFNKERYTQWNVQSGYHNVPKINSTDQHDGKAFKARDVKSDISASRVHFELDIAGAYPQTAGIDRWKRSFDFVRGKSVTVTERYQFKTAPSAPTEIMLMTVAKPRMENGKIVLDADGDAYEISFAPSKLSASIEEIPLDDKVVSDNWNTSSLYRIHLRLLSDALKGKVTYSLSQRKGSVVVGD